MNTKEIRYPDARPFSTIFIVEWFTMDDECGVEPRPFRKETQAAARAQEIKDAHPDCSVRVVRVEKTEVASHRTD